MDQRHPPSSLDALIESTIGMKLNEKEKEDFKEKQNNSTLEAAEATSSSHQPPNATFLFGTLPLNLASLPLDVLRLIFSWLDQPSLISSQFVSRQFQTLAKEVLTEEEVSVDRFTEDAAFHGYLEILKWARSLGWSRLTEDLCSRAALGGQLEVLKWLRLIGCPWDEWTCMFAANRGFLEVLQWARANGCPWSTLTTSNAAANGHVEVLQWAIENGCPCDPDIDTKLRRRKDK